MNPRYYIRQAGGSFTEEAGLYSYPASKLKKFKFKVSSDGNVLTAVHEKSDLVKITIKPINKEDENGEEVTIYRMSMKSPLYDNAIDSYYLNISADGRSPKEAFDLWYPKALEEFKAVKKKWAKEVNGQIGRRFYWLQGFFANRFLKKKR